MPLLTRLSDTLGLLYRKPSLREGSIVLIDQGFFSVATFVTGVLVARASTKEEYAVYVLGWSLVLIIQGLQRALVNGPFTVYAPRLNRYLIAIFITAVRLFILLFSVSYAR